MSFREDFIKSLISRFFATLHKAFGLISKKDYAGSSEMVSNMRLELLGISDQLANTLSAPDLISMLTSEEEPNPAKPLIMAELYKVEGDIYSEKDEENSGFSSYLKSLELLLEIAQVFDETDFPDEFSDVELVAGLLDDFVLPSETLAALFHYYESAGKYGLAEEALFDYIEDSSSEADGIAAGLLFVERLKEVSADELDKGELSPSDLSDIEKQLLKIQSELKK